MRKRSQTYSSPSMSLQYWHHETEGKIGTCFRRNQPHLLLSVRCKNRTYDSNTLGSCLVGSDILCSLIIGRMKDGLLCRPFSFYPSPYIQKSEITKNFRLNIMLNLQNAIRVPIIISTFASPIGGSV